MNPWLIFGLLACDDALFGLDVTVQIDPYAPTYCNSLPEDKSRLCEKKALDLESQCSTLSLDPSIQQSCEQKRLEYQRDCVSIEEIITQNCVSCHHAPIEGEVDAPVAGFLPLDSHQPTYMFGPLIEAAVQGYGPTPMPPRFDTESTECPRDLQIPFVSPISTLSESSISSLVAYVEAGSPLGDVTKCQYDPYRPATQQNPDLTTGETSLHLTEGDSYFSSNGYETLPASAQISDELICFSIDPGKTVDSYISGIEFLIDNTSVVHHILLFEDVSGESGPAAGAQGYYECSQDMVSTQLRFLADWIPGQTAIIPPSGAPFKFRAGSRLMYQLHYHNTSDAQFDQTGVKLQWSQEIPSTVSVVFLKGLTGSGEYEGGIQADGTGSLTPPSLIPVADPPGSEWVERVQIKIPEEIGTTTDYPIWSVAIHMHNQGKRGLLKRTYTSKAEDTSCLLEVDWDFMWQQTYNYDLNDGDYPTLRGGDLFEVKCVYENQTDHEVKFGEGSEDEMCLGIVGVVIPNKP